MRLLLKIVCLLFIAFLKFHRVMIIVLKGYTVPKSISIVKCTEDDTDMMYLNASFLKFFPAAEVPETRVEGCRSGYLRVGTYLVLRYEQDEDL